MRLRMTNDGDVGGDGCCVELFGELVVQRVHLVWMDAIGAFSLFALFVCGVFFKDATEEECENC